MTGLIQYIRVFTLSRDPTFGNGILQSLIFWNF